ncbi:MAG: hypothetical protein MJ223_01475 [Mycoplasmoidaceae bacterium]|nr:hypothetical protein [Mycoplasmoidaceae bacterium]
MALRKMTEYAKKHNCKEISTTLAVLVIVNDKFYTYNIGDTRIYIAEKTKDK